MCERRTDGVSPLVVEFDVHDSSSSSLVEVGLSRFISPILLLSFDESEMKQSFLFF